LADDDEAHRQVVAHALAKRVGHTVIESVGDGERALEAAMARTPDLAILDLDMPGLNGLELAIALRTTPKLERLPIVIVSGCLGPDEREVLRRIGVERCFDKPVLLWRLSSAVRELLGVSGELRPSGRYPRADVHRNARTPDPEDAE
jgi:CheY-like chemotaxis protein